jgi:uncharacterized protein YyaL (SSP411 family)
MRVDTRTDKTEFVSLLSEVGVTPKEIRRAFERAVEWILSSGIHNLNNRPRVHGAINSWYDCGVKIYPYAYSEVAGYAIKLFLYLYSITHEDRFLQRAELTADWISNYAQEPDTPEIKFRFYYHLDDFSPKHAYAFDTGIVLGGFAQLYATTRNGHYLYTAKELAHWLQQVMQLEDGSFCCVYDMEDRIRLNSPDVWSKQPGPYHTKIAASMLLASLVAKEPGFAESARRHCEWVVAQQEPDGRFLSRPLDRSTLTHAHCYACEGLLSVGLRLGETRLVESAVKGIEWLLANQRDDGGIPAEYKEGAFLGYMRTDALAQTLRLVWTAVRSGVLEDWHLSQAASMLKRLLELQCGGTVRAENGGFYYLTQGDGSVQRHLNSWVTMFSIQALGLTLDVIDAKPLIDLNYLL